LGDERRLRELREEEARLRELEQSDDVGLRLDALRNDIRMAQADLDETIAGARERAQRLEGGAGDDQSSP
jgi:predicted  nucleic acid-binding Zn-ribbon protein